MYAHGGRGHNAVPLQVRFESLCSTGGTVLRRLGRQLITQRYYILHDIWARAKMGIGHQHTSMILGGLGHAGGFIGPIL